MRKLILIPAVALVAGLMFSETAYAQPRPIGPAPFVRPVGPGPIVDIRSPRIGIGISIGSPVVPVYRPPVVVVDPYYDTYRVVYRDCSHDPWRTYRVYESHRYAHLVVDQLRDRGYQARVIHD